MHQPGDTHFLPARRAFVVQFSTATTVGQQRFTGRVEHVVSGQAASFHTLEELLLFMSRLLGTYETAPEALPESAAPAPVTVPEETCPTTTTTQSVSAALGAPAPLRHLEKGAHTMSHDSERSLYDRLGGYDAIAAVARELVTRLQADAQLGRFWQHRGADGVARELQLLIDFLCASAGGPMYYTGRDMALAHQGMRISESDWAALLRHATATLAHFHVPETETQQVLAFVESTKADIVEVA